MRQLACPVVPLLLQVPFSVVLALIHLIQAGIISPEWPGEVLMVTSLLAVLIALTLLEFELKLYIKNPQDYPDRLSS